MRRRIDRCLADTDDETLTKVNIHNDTRIHVLGGCKVSEEEQCS
jgi:hypothetical protein